MGRKKFVRVLSGLMTFVLLLSLMPLNVLAADDVEEPAVDAEITSVIVTAVTQGEEAAEGGEPVMIPLPGADVKIGDLTYTADANGQVTLENLTVGGEYTVSVGCEGYAPKEQTFTAETDGAVEVELTAYTVVTVSGVVTCEDAAVGGVTVTLACGDSVETTTTDDSGAFSFENVYKELVSYVSVSGTGYVASENIAVNFEGNTDISIEKQTFSITASAGRQGTGTVEAADDSVKYGGETSVVIQAEEGYSIYCITDNGVTVAKEASGAAEYEYLLSDITSKRDVVVYFTEDVAEIQFWVDNNGRIYQQDEQQDPDAEITYHEVYYIPGLSVSKDADSGEVTVEYVPSANYRVSAVMVDDGEAETYDENDKTYASEPFALEDEVKRGYVIEVRLNQFAVKLAENMPEEAANCIEISNETVSYGSSATLKITPPEGQYLSSLTINNVDVLSGIDYSGETPVYDLVDVTEEKEVTAAFAEITENADLDVEISERNTVVEEDIYYLSNVKGSEGIVVLTVTDAKVSRFQNGPFADSVEVTESEEIEKLYVLKENVISEEECVVTAVKDESVPVEDKDVKKNWLGNKIRSVTWTINANDEGGSGIDRVVFSENKDLTHTQIRELPAENEAEINDDDGTYSKTFGENVKTTYYFWAIDKAGNVSNRSDCPVDTDNLTPVIDSFTLEGAISYGAGDYIVNYAGPGVIFTVTCHDEHSGIESAKLYIGDDDFPMLYDGTDNGNYIYKAVINNFDEDGIYKGEVSVIVTDNSESKNSTEGETYAKVNQLDSYSITVENHAPEITKVKRITEPYISEETGKWYRYQPNIKKEDGTETYVPDAGFIVTIKDDGAGLVLDEAENLVIDIPNAEIKTLSTVEETVTVTNTSVDEITGDEIILEEEVGTGRIVEAKIEITVDGSADKDIGFDLAIDVEDTVHNSRTYTSEECGDLKFTVDGAAPSIEKFDISGKITEERKEAVEGEETDIERAYTDSNEKDVIATSYGYHFQRDTKVKVWADDTGSGVKEISFYKVSHAENSGETATQTQAVETAPAQYDEQSDLWFAEFDVEEGFKGQIYAYAADNVANSSSAGEEQDRHPEQMTTVESQDRHKLFGGVEVKNEKGELVNKHITFTLPESVGTDEKGNPIYTMLKNNEEDKGINIGVKVTDTFNGISKISYTVKYPTDDEPEEVEVSWNGEEGSWTVAKDGTDKNLNTVIDGTITLTDQSNGIVVEVSMRDNAGNQSVESYTLSIDNTAPVFEYKHIAPTSGDDVYPSEGNEQESLGTTPYFVGYAADAYDYNELAQEYPIYAGGTLQIRVYERNMTKEDLAASAVKLLEGSDLDNIEVRNLADTIKIDGPYYDAYNAETGNTVRREAAYPYSENVYYVIELQDCAEEASGGTYVTEFSVTDKAGHSEKMSEFFVIDDIAPAVTITFDNNDVLNGMYYDAARVATITVVERNFNNSTGTVAGAASDDGAAFAFPTLSGWTDSANGTTHTATVSFTSDGLYRDFSLTYTDLAERSGSNEANDFVVDTIMPEITITGVEDKSANNGTVAPSITYSDTNLNLDSVVITLTGANSGVVEYLATTTEIHNGQTYLYADFDHEKAVDDIYTLYVYALDLAGNQMTQTIQFSCNRFGSVFDLSGIADMLGKYNQEERNIVVTETNVDAIDLNAVRITLTKNGTPIDLVQGEDYRVTEVGGDGSWSQYTYEIFSKLFADDGTYSLYIYTEDAAGNINENIDDSKEAQISFGIDKTSPIVNPIDLENDKQYAVDGKTVSVEIKDNLLLEGVKIYLNDEEINYVVDGDSYVFDIPESNSKQTVRIVAVDAAGNERVILVQDFLVTTNIFARWYNNTPLFIGSMVLLAALLGLAGWRIFILLFKKKDEEEEN